MLLEFFSHNFRDFISVILIYRNSLPGFFTMSGYLNYQVTGSFIFKVQIDFFTIDKHTKLYFNMLL